ncbi:hypothetical protein Vretimale_14479, partial [Volvox reticuliferus]
HITPADASAGATTSGVPPGTLSTAGSRSGANVGGAVDGGGGQSHHNQAPPKLLVFAHHKDVMDRLAEALQGFDGAEGSGGTGGDDDDGGGGDAAVWQGVNYVRIDGSHDSGERRTAVMRFRDDPTVRVALLSITAAAVGLDFSTASAVVFVELPTEVSLLQQAEDRAHRKGQEHACVNVYFLCAKGTCDDKRWQKLNDSLNNLTQVHDGSEAGNTCGGRAGGGVRGGGGAVTGLTVDTVVDLDELKHQLDQRVDEQYVSGDGAVAAAAAPHEVEPAAAAA